MSELQTVLMRAVELAARKELESGLHLANKMEYLMALPMVAETVHHLELKLGLPTAHPKVGESVRQMVQQKV